MTIEPHVRYRYRLIDVRETDAEALLNSPHVNEAIFAVLCRMEDAQSRVHRIVERIADLPSAERKEAIAQLLMLSGSRGLKSTGEVGGRTNAEQY